MTAEQKIIRSLANKGTKKSVDHKNKIKKSLRKKHPKDLWASLRNSTKYEEWRQSCIKRDNNMCSHCYKKENLHVHHIQSIKEIFKGYNITSLKHADNCKLLWSLDNGITLCNSCHHKLHWHLKGIAKGR